MRKLLISKIQSESGSTLLLVMGMILGVGLLAGVGATIATNLFKTAQNANSVQSVQSLVNVVETIGSNQKACTGTPVGTGLQFRGASAYSANSYDNALASTPAGQQISLESNLTGAAGGRIRVEQNVDMVDLDLKIESFYIRNAVDKPGTPNTKTGELVIAASQITSGRPLAPRVVGSLNLVFVNPAVNDYTFISCAIEPSAQAVCERLGCRYIPTALNQQCVCGFPDLDCNTGIGPSDPRRYVAGFDAATMTPICKDLEISCESKGPGFFMSGVDAQGQPICLAVYTSASPTPGPTASPIPPSTCVASASFSVCGPGKCKGNSSGTFAAIAMTSFGAGAEPEANGSCSGTVWVGGVPTAFSFTCDAPPGDTICGTTQNFMANGLNVTVDIDLDTGAPFGGTAIYTCTVMPACP